MRMIYTHHPHASIALKEAGAVRELRGRTSSSSSGTGQTSSRTSQSRPSSGTGQTSSRTSQSRPPSGTGRTSSRTSQSRPNRAPPPPRTPPPRRASTPPRAVHVECPHCKKFVIPTKGEPFNWIKFLILDGLPWLIWGERKGEKPGCCSNCGKSLPANLLNPRQRFYDLRQ